MSSSIYLDYAAATPLDERVFFAMEPYLTQQFYNPSSLYDAARIVRSDYEEARHSLARTIGAKQHEIIITAGATESINLAIHGVIGHYGGAVATAEIEHLAVLEAAKERDLQVIPVTEKGYITPEAVASVITSETTLVSVGYINNELGTVQPLRDIAIVLEHERQRRLQNGETRPIYFHTDASQAAGLLDCSMSRLGVDLMTLNAAKCYGPKQVGLLWVRAGIILQPVLRGGSQERSLRAGTENVAGTVGFARALELAQEQRKTESHRLSGLRDRLQDKISKEISDVIINGHAKKRAPHILHISVAGLDGERAIFALDQAGVMAATGSACAANSGTRSHVLVAASFDDTRADGSLRFSLGKFTSETEIDQASQIIIDVIQKERQHV
jgi:cysteine desulfurase